jgi:uncharacterized protein
MDGSIVTHSGQRFYFERPEEFEYKLSDIGFALGNLCRFSGQLGWWSVAQHSLLVEHMVEPRDKFRALLHDASEAFLVDVPGPLKQLPIMNGYKELEAKVMVAIHKQFGVPVDEEAERRVKVADIAARRAEGEMLGFLKSDWPEWEQVPVEIPEWIRKLNNGQAGKVFGGRAVWYLKEREHDD